MMKANLQTVLLLRTPYGNTNASTHRPVFLFSLPVLSRADLFCFFLQKNHLSSIGIIVMRNEDICCLQATHHLFEMMPFASVQKC